MRKICIIIFSLSINMILIHAYAPFVTLDQIYQYTKAYPEQPKNDSLNWLDPDYTFFHYSITPGPIFRLLYRFGIGGSTVWDGYAFKALLEHINNLREALKLSGNSVVRLRCKPDTALYIWSDLFGGLHSLVRCLLWFKDQGIIDDTLKIVKQNTYFIFNGNVIGRTPYNIETLHLLLLLMQKNPDSVFYVRGKNETNQYWQNFTTARELIARARYLSPEEIPLSSLINKFFNTLPYAIYISTEDNASEVIRISFTGRDTSIINENTMGSLFSKQLDNPIIYYDLNKKKQTESPVTIKVVIKGEDWVKGQHTGDNGLKLLEQDMGSTAWSVISSPTKGFQIFYNFFYDAFSMITVGKTIDTSTITLYQQNFNRLDGFKKEKTYNIVTGIPEDSPAYTQPRKQNIVLGSSMALDQGLPAMGKQVKRGMSVKINDINQTGGINGHFIRTVIYNDDYIPNLARQNIISLMNQGIDTIVLPIGSPTLSSYEEFIEELKIAVLFPVTGSSEFRKSTLKGIINWRATYEDEVKALMDYLITEYSARKFTFFYQDDSYGLGAVEAAHTFLQSKGIQEWTDIPYTRATIDFEEQARKVRESQPDAIGFFSTTHPTQELLRQIGIQALANRQLFGISFLAEESFRRFLKSNGLKMLFGSVVPNPQTSQLDIVREYRAIMDRDAYVYDVFSLEAFITTSILIDVLTQLTDPITKNTILAKLESLNNYQFKGLTLTFNPERRDLAQYVWLETEKDEEWMQKSIK